MVYAIQESKFVKKTSLNEYFCVFTAAIMMLAAGIAYGWFPPNVLTLSDKFGISKDSVDFLPTLVQLTSIPGLILSNILSNKLGRKLASQLSILPVIIGFLVLIIRQTPFTLTLNCILYGYSFGTVFVLVPTYICEISSIHNRGIFAALLMTILNSGSLVEYILVPMIDFNLNLIICLIFPVIFLLLSFQIPESPYWLCSTNRIDEAKKSLIFIRKSSKIEKEFEEIRISIEREKNEKGTMMDLIRIPSNRKALIINIITFFAQNLSGLVIYQQFSQDIFDKVESKVISTELSGILFVFSNLVFGVIVSPFAETFGRKPLLIVSVLLNGIFNIILGMFFYLQQIHLIKINFLGILPLICLMGINFSNSLGLFSIIFAYLSETFPTNIRSLSCSIINIFGTVFALVTLQVYLFSTSNFGFFSVYFIFGGICFICTVIFAFILFETKGCSLDEIQRILKNEKK